MAERPILFSAPMVRALLEGRKTQPRRLIKAPGIEEAVAGHYYPSLNAAQFRRADGRDSLPLTCPYGRVGDRLWVRETWGAMSSELSRASVAYAARLPAGKTLQDTDGGCNVVTVPEEWRDRLGHLVDTERWRPSIHMPRWASRLTLEVTDIRVQRLQDITGEDAQAEGARRFDELPSVHPCGQGPRWSMEAPSSTWQCLGSARMAFANYINALHGGPRWNLKDEAPLWDRNPWVWAVRFRLVEGSR